MNILSKNGKQKLNIEATLLVHTNYYIIKLDKYIDKYFMGK